MFDSRVFRVAGSNGAISAYIKSKMAAPRLRPTAILENFKWPYLRKGSCCPFHIKTLF